MNRPGVNCPGVNCPGVNCPGVNCPDTQLTKAGHTVVKAVDAAGTTMRTFRKKRYIVEMKYAHLSTFLNLQSVYTTKNSLAVECQKELKKSVYHEKRMTNFLNGLCLKPFKM